MKKLLLSLLSLGLIYSPQSLATNCTIEHISPSPEVRKTFAEFAKVEDIKGYERLCQQLQRNNAMLCLNGHKNNLKNNTAYAWASASVGDRKTGLCSTASGGSSTVVFGKNYSEQILQQELYQTILVAIEGIQLRPALKSLNHRRNQ